MVVARAMSAQAAAQPIAAAAPTGGGCAKAGRIPAAAAVTPFPDVPGDDGRAAAGGAGGAEARGSARASGAGGRGGGAPADSGHGGQAPRNSSRDCAPSGCSGDDLTMVPDAVHSHFVVARPQRRRVSAALMGDLRTVCLNYHASSYDTLSFVDERRTRCYEDSLRRVAPGACVMDIGTGANATLALLALRAGAVLVVAFELNEAALRSAVSVLGEYMESITPQASRQRRKRASTKGVVAWRRAGGGQEVWVLRGDATASIAHPDLRARLELAKAAGLRVVLVHELLDDFATSEDVCHIVGSAQRAVRGVFGETFLPESVPQRVFTMARALWVPGEGFGEPAAPKRRRKDAAPAQSWLTRSGSALFTHAAIPAEWFRSAPQAVEDVDFGRLCPLGDVAGPMLAKFVCDGPANAVALSLEIDFGGGSRYRVAGERSSNWRTIIVGVPPRVGREPPYSFTVQLVMRRCAEARVSYELRFADAHAQASGRVRLSWDDLVSVLASE